MCVCACVRACVRARVYLCICFSVFLNVLNENPSEKILGTPNLLTYVLVLYFSYTGKEIYDL